MLHDYCSCYSITKISQSTVYRIYTENLSCCKLLIVVEQNSKEWHLHVHFWIIVRKRQISHLMTTVRWWNMYLLPHCRVETNPCSSIIQLHQRQKKKKNSSKLSQMKDYGHWLLGPKSVLLLDFVKPGTKVDVDSELLTKLGHTIQDNMCPCTTVHAPVYNDRPLKENRRPRRKPRKAP